MDFLGWVLAAIMFHSVAAEGENPSIPGCGVSKVSSPETKIVGGRNATPGEFPYQLSFMMRTMPVVTKFQHICGASLIDENFAITAAHCIAGGVFASYQVVVGINDLRNASSGVKSNVIAYVHEQYKPMVSLENDIALLKLLTPIDINSSDGRINGVCLPDRDLADNVDGMGTVTGWGTTSQGGQLSNTLKAVDVPLITDEACRESYGEDMVTDTMLCAGYPEGGKDSCQGDSGGPLVQRNSEGISTLIGIVSWGKGCAQPDNPGVYTETAHYMDWIVRTMKTLNSTFGGGGGSESPNSGSGGESGSSGGESGGDSGAAPAEESDGAPEGAAEHPEEPNEEDEPMENNESIMTTPHLPEGVIIKN